MTDLKEDIEEKQDKGIFKIIHDVQLQNQVDEFIEELGKRDDVNAQWFAIRWDIAKSDKKTSRGLFIIIFQLFIMSVAILLVAMNQFFGK